jgi:hypothetical protein
LTADIAHRFRATDRSFAPKRYFIEADQCDLGRPVLDQKIFSFPSEANHLHISRRLVPLEGRFAIVTSAGRDAVDADGALDECA